MSHPDTLQSAHQVCDPNMNAQLLLHPSSFFFTHPHPVPGGYGSVPPTQNSQQSQPPVGGGQGGCCSAVNRDRKHLSHSTELTLSLLPDHAPLQLFLTAIPLVPSSSVSPASVLKPRPGRVSVRYYFSHPCLLHDRGGSWHRSPEKDSGGPGGKERNSKLVSMSRNTPT